MTMGQRIAQRRKELGLSQEALGERLGVSRQAIYKWESNAALPEIEKLVNLSRAFGVSVGWLLGEEEGEVRELTPEQLRMVEEIVGRYLAAQPPEKTIILRETVEPEEGEKTAPEPRPPKRRRWSWILAGLALTGLALTGTLLSLFSRLDQMQQENQNLQMAVANIRSDVNREISGITSRVEEVLQSQNTLIAEQSAQVAEADYRANTVTVEARALPRTYVEGMEAEFTLDSGGEAVTVPGVLGADHAFTARLTGPLSDDITVSVALLTGGQRQTQVLEEVRSLYSDSFATIQISGGLKQLSKSSDSVNWTAEFSPVYVDCYGKYGEATQVARVRVGLFRNQKLVAWFTEEEQSAGDGNYVFRMEPDRMEMESDSIYCIAVVVEDEFGREWVEFDRHSADRFAVGEKDRAPDVDYSRDPADWEY